MEPRLPFDYVNDRYDRTPTTRFSRSTNLLLPYNPPARASDRGQSFFGQSFFLRARVRAALRAAAERLLELRCLAAERA